MFTHACMYIHVKIILQIHHTCICTCSHTYTHNKHIQKTDRHRHKGTHGQTHRDRQTHKYTQSQTPIQTQTHAHTHNTQRQRHTLTLEKVPGKTAMAIPQAINQGTTRPIFGCNTAFPVSLVFSLTLFIKFLMLNFVVDSSFKLSRKNTDKIKAITHIPVSVPSRNKPIDFLVVLMHIPQNWQL